MKRFQITISGPNVQRCGFRKEAARVAREMGLNGQAAYVGQDVVVEVEGAPDNTNRFLHWCYIGPVGVMIENVGVFEQTVHGNHDFVIIHGVNFSGLKESA